VPARRRRIAKAGDVSQARRALDEAGSSIDGLARGNFLALARLADAVSDLGDCLALGGVPARHVVEVINELAARCIATARLSVNGTALHREVNWRDPDPVAGLARQIIAELDGIDSSRIRQCQRQECDLLFFDPTRPDAFEVAAMARREPVWVA
jgi:predicted RNA-binding Zn ribbon-like protein